jgi:hypothetical protein
VPSYCALGAPFLRTVLAVFDARDPTGPPRVGFSAQPTASTGRRQLQLQQEEAEQGAINLLVHRATAAEVQRRRRRRRLQVMQGVELDALEAVQYFAPVSIGTPAQVGDGLLPSCVVPPPDSASSSYPFACTQRHLNARCIGQGPFLLQLDTGSGLLVVLSTDPSLSWWTGPMFGLPGTGCHHLDTPALQCHGVAYGSFVVQPLCYVWC